MATKRLSRILPWMSPKDSNHKKETSRASEVVATETSSKNWTKLPTFDELPSFQNMPGCAWEVWGKDDQLGTINLLTEEVVKLAASEEIRTTYTSSGITISLNWPLNFPSKPLFGRKSPEINMLPRPNRVVRDDEIHINTQSGSQWDGLRHFGLQDHGVFYNNTPKDSMVGGLVPLHDPLAIDPNLARIGIQTGTPARDLPYDPWTTHGLTVADLQACAEKQGVKFRQGDILILRVGFIRKYQNATQEDRDALVARPETFAGIEQSEDMKRFLWNNHFAAIASDQPALERWPKPEGVSYMHETLLALWGMPIGEMFDVEKLSEVCENTGRYTFFFSSWPLPIIGGCASPPNAAVREDFRFGVTQCTEPPPFIIKAYF
ncbi:hypothetical protein D9757_012874 [Collybiopsis confluens]|uniref:Cyclase n=1 Tax=Collybiopsis confluens TaxID=2823264 RepID=A0A8H5FVN5_9AGAR|nr:hypothetical protein D9757_012874 [Collybiopsis confluens]